jgi:hypothetical protein
MGGKQRWGHGGGIEDVGAESEEAELRWGSSRRDSGMSGHRTGSGRGLGAGVSRGGGRRGHGDAIWTPTLCPYIYIYIM